MPDPRPASVQNPAAPGVGASRRIVLLVDDEPDMGALLEHTLDPAGFELIAAGDTTVAERLIRDRNPDLMLLDWVLPSVSGLTFLRRLRRNHATRELPIIMLSVRDSVEDRALALDAGADDYVCKPFSCRELRARIDALLRRTASGVAVEPERIRRGKLTMDLAAHRVWLGDLEVPLTPREYDLLEFLVQHEGKTFSRRALVSQVGAGRRYRLERTIDVHVAGLRRALAAGKGEGLIETVRGQGYRFAPQGD
jgi:two-component system phosphate regulon response regulator PhoB